MNHKERGLNPKDAFKKEIERIYTILVDKNSAKSCCLKMFKFLYLGEFLRYGPDFWPVIVTFKMNFSNMEFTVLLH